MYSTNIQVPIECLENLTEEEYYKEQYEIHFGENIQENNEFLKLEEEEWDNLLKKENL